MAYNTIGPALPQALRALRYLLYDPDGNFRETDKIDLDTMATACRKSTMPVLLPRKRNKLEQNSEVVNTLEDIFSLTCVARPIHPRAYNSIFGQKTGPHGRNILMPEESWHFQRAVHRIWLYTSIFPGDRYSLDDINELDHDKIDLIQRQRTAMLNEYPTDELFQIYAVVRFFRGILAGVWDEEHDNPNNPSISGAGRHRRRMGTPFIPISRGRGEPTVQRLLLPPSRKHLDRRAILDTITGADDTSSKCAASCRLTIPTETYWHRLHIWRDDLLNGWLKSSSDLSGSLTASAFQHKGRNRRGIGPWIASLSMCPAQPLDEHV
ncbi:hypothetical protein B0H13DRAFT_2655072 [Mycena leptocephala]|nr:hypothetical protein B0H13DRAFT_2655072 [Mycena leptocephala]